MHGNDILLSDLLASRQQSHKRSPGEYVRPDEELRIGTWKLAKSIPIDSDRSFAEVPLSWAGVRGTIYADATQWDFKPSKWKRLWGELVPEPLNKHDDHALAIDLQGRRLGYTPTRYAQYGHAYVSSLNSRGHHVLIPIKFRTDFNRHLDMPVASAFAALPTFQEYEKRLPSDAQYILLLRPLWEKLDEAVVQEIVCAGFHLSERTFTEIVKLRELAPEAGLPLEPRMSAIPRGLNVFLMHQRLELHRELHQQRAIRDAKLVSAYRGGLTQAAVARLHGVSTSIVSKALKRASVDTRRPVRKSSKRRLA